MGILWTVIVAPESLMKAGLVVFPSIMPLGLNPAALNHDPDAVTGSPTLGMRDGCGSPATVTTWSMVVVPLGWSVRIVRPLTVP